jgi:uncharacterized phage protein gp47/JayE
MPLEFDTIPEKEAKILSDVDTALGQTTPEEEIAYNRIWARAIAGLSKILDKVISVAVKSILLSTTKDETILQNDWSVWTKTARKLSTQSQLNVDGTGVASAIIAGGINGKSYVSEDGQKFYFENDYVIPVSGIVDTVLTAFLPGPQGNLKKGNLSITSQDPNISDTLVIREADPIAVEGTDIESIDSWKAEMQRVAKRPVTSDNNSFYFSTARQRPNIVAGYPYTDKPGQLDLYAESDSASGVPTDDQISDLESYFFGGIDNVSRLPLDMEGNLPDDATVARFRVHKSLQSAFETTVLGLDPATAENKTAITEAIQEYYSTRKPYVKGVSIENTGTITQNGLRSVVQSKIEELEANSFSDVTFKTDPGGIVYTKYPLGRGERCKSDTVGYI